MLNVTIYIDHKAPKQSWINRNNSNDTILIISAPLTMPWHMKRETTTSYFN